MEHPTSLKLRRTEATNDRSGFGPPVADSPAANLDIGGKGKEGKNFMKKLVIFVDKRGFGCYPCFHKDKHCEIREREKIIID